MDSGGTMWYLLKYGTRRLSPLICFVSFLALCALGPLGQTPASDCADALGESAVRISKKSRRHMWKQRRPMMLHPQWAAGSTESCKLEVRCIDSCILRHFYVVYVLPGVTLVERSESEGLNDDMAPNSYSAIKAPGSQGPPLQGKSSLWHLASEGVPCQLLLLFQEVASWFILSPSFPKQNKHR